MEIRRYAPGDFDAVSRICLLTAAAGRDATGEYSTDELMPDLWARPYLALDPDYAWVVDDGDGVCGYLLGVPDTRLFVERYRAEWLTYLAERYPHPPAGDEAMLALGLHPERMLIPELAEYPAHLHIDLLPRAQGRGIGRRLITTLETALRSSDVPGVHLGLDPANTGARAFYARLGFVDLPSSTPEEPVLAKQL